MKAKSTPVSAPNSRRVIRMSQLRQKYPVSESQIFSLMKKGIFPKPFALVPGGRAVGWFEDEIDEYLANCQEAAIGKSSHSAVAEIHLSSADTVNRLEFNQTHSEGTQNSFVKKNRIGRKKSDA